MEKGISGLRRRSQGAGGHRLPALLCLPLPAEPGTGPPGAGRQSGGAGGRAQGERGDGARGGPYPRPPGGAEPRRPRHGLCPRRRRGRLRPADLPLGGAGDAQPAHRAGRRGGHQNVRPQPQAPADAAAGEGLCHHGPGSRLPQRLQGGGGGRHRQGAGHGGGLPHVQPAEEGGGHRHAGKAHPPPRRGPHRHRQRHRQPGDRADDGGAHQAAGRRRQLHDRQRGGGLGLLRLQAGRGGVPRLRREPAKRRVHRPAAPGSPGRAGEDRPQEHRRGTVPARHAPGPAGRDPLRRGGGLRQRGGGGSQHRLRPPAVLRGGAEQHHRQEHRQVPGGERSLHHPEGGAQGAQAGAQGL